ncbi:GntR family transcriptional regulator [Puniceibacterium sediminis]|uniref:Transcriptional regulator, GntR family n=1 Tax=Puniceibacterium sediminis TaxID=1608407 RepID=A0A238VIL9_9RHOB|nr:GntR family transcriptional regulator [Puniceibacterium sediminis]SNR34225.1 transcriptional regulator, GntR family [Puniceibacterium sediminis]
MTKATSRHQRLYTELRSRICLLDYPPGTRLSEETLAADFGTSRTPLRRALARLEDEGLVISRHGVGTLVTDVSIGELTQTYALRLELAQLTAALSPRPVTAQTLSEIDDFVIRGEDLVAQPDPRAFAELNMAYHGFGLSLSDNAPLRDTAERLYFHTARIWLMAIPRMDLAQECAIFLDEMRQTRAALALPDLQAVALIRRAHISMSFRRLSML